MDLALTFRPEKGYFDLALSTTGQPETTDTLATWIIRSLFTDARALPDEELPNSHNPDADTWRRGTWFDAVPMVAGDKYGSKLWLLNREITSPETLNRAQNYCEDALAWLVRDGVAKRVQVYCEYVQKAPTGILGILVVAERPTAPGSEAYFYVWDQIRAQTMADPDQYLATFNNTLTIETGAQLISEDGVYHFVTE